MHRIQELIRVDAQRMQLLRAVTSLALPDCYVAAGFVRNMVWDQLHGYEATPLNDVDVVFFDRVNASSRVTEHMQEKLSSLEPSVRWEVKNQAIMHTRNNDQPYTSTADSMSYWPEKETAVGVILKSSGTIEVVAPFGLDSLFSGCVSHNPKRPRSVFMKRLNEKQWLEKWPRLKLVLQQSNAPDKRVIATLRARKHRWNLKLRMNRPINKFVAFTMVWLSSTSHGFLVTTNGRLDCFPEGPTES